LNSAVINGSVTLPRHLHFPPKFRAKRKPGFDDGVGICDLASATPLHQPPRPNQMQPMAPLPTNTHVFIGFATSLEIRHMQHSIYGGLRLPKVRPMLSSESQDQAPASIKSHIVGAEQKTPSAPETDR
jgi:hypothetical protein